MENIATDKRREILIFLLTAIVIAFLVGGIETVLFSTPFLALAHRKLILFCSFILLAVATACLYAVVIASVRRLSMEVRFPLTFDRARCCFVDLPHCPMSVNARVCFSQLPETGRKHLACYDETPGFFGSELNRFIDHVVQEVLLTRVIFIPTWKDPKKKEYTRLRGSDLPLGVQENRFIKGWVGELDGDRITVVPHLKGIQTYGRNNSFLRVTTKGGGLEVSWEVAFFNSAYYSEAFLSGQTDADYSFHDFEVTVSLIRSCSALRIFSSKVRDFVNWASGAEKTLATYDWNFSQADRLVHLLSRIVHSAGDGSDDGNAGGAGG